MRRIEFDGTSRPGPQEQFTGRVWMEPNPAEPPEAGAFRVFFEPGARTNWHTHPEGQVLYVVTGRGRAGNESDGRTELSPGDVVTFAPNERHWHGAAPDSYMVHIAINPAVDSEGGTDWQGPVTDEEYGFRSGL
ncbi:cupin domain-containing protein [Rubrobacter indicoceani]|uniref:(R)-mandelonitrile lyase n=1 Tax=Rubrobacter indicoceani TaxID=2051957 RepID=UPI001F09E09A|nr:cupin domain-containing protein [Rubrobacter indicoceani]